VEHLEKGAATMTRSLSTRSRSRLARAVVPALAILLAAGGCGDGKHVVVYTALDREFSEPVLKGYEQKAGVRIDAKYDVESTKTVGLTQLIAAEAESGRPRCDLFWNNEIVNTLRLKQKGLLAPIHPSNAVTYPDEFKSKDGTWYGFAARSRVILVNTKHVPPSQRPASINDLVDPKWKGKIAIAKPMFGTTATHAVCLFSVWGSEKARAFFHTLKANDVQVVSGNKQVATAVGSGQAALGLTDTDDAMGEVAAGSPVVIIYPDRKPDELGTLFIPNTLAVLKGAPHAADAEALANALLAPSVEAELARGPSAQIPLNANVDEPPQVETPRTVHPMAIDWDAAVKLWDEVMTFLTAEFGG
jgi:iron(III) transport system substrate-binding protein